METERVNEPASGASVARYLVANYVVTEARARDLVEKHHGVVERAMAVGAYAWNPGELIADVAELGERAPFSPWPFDNLRDAIDRSGAPTPAKGAR